MKQAVEQGGLGRSSRRMLRRLRDVMAAPGALEDRLNRIVAIIAAGMVAEVCSVYVRRPGDVLELCATQGLNPEAVHRTRLRFGEGLVGHIAARGRAISLADAQSHPKFAYRPETGEEVFQSLLGVPIRRARRVVGVLVVQNRTHRAYTEEEGETLETFAMVLAEMLAGEAADQASGGPDRLRPVREAARIAGLSLVPGMAIGRAHLHGRGIVIRRVIADNPRQEFDRLQHAFDDMQSRLDRLFRLAAIPATGEHAEVLEAYRMIARDTGWLARIKEAILGGLTAEAAVQKTLDETRLRFGRIDDSYLAERIFDIEDLTNQLLAALAAIDAAGAPSDGGRGPDPGIPEDAVIVARAMGPADLLEYDGARLRGLVLQEGSAAAHVAIVARALDIPVVGRAGGILGEVEPGDVVIVDGDHAQVFLRPRDEVQAQFHAARTARRVAQARYGRLRDAPSETRDGRRISLQMNAGLLLDLPRLEETGADGVGLYRTEIPFMARRDYPDFAAQYDLYRRIYDGAGDRPVVFRTLDAGGDKTLSAFAHDAGDNPAMGWRGLRIALDRPSMLRQQTRALIAAADGRPLRLMFPLVATAGELARARHILDLEVRRAAERGRRRPEPLRIGAMLEVPALLWQMPELLRQIDFLSIGSNDLLQFLYAADRGSERMARRYDSLSVPFLRLLAWVRAHCAAAGVPVTVCGEMAGQPADVLALIGLGYDRLSMSAVAIGPIKEIIGKVHHGELSRFMRGLLAAAGDGAGHHGAARDGVRARIRAYARDHGIEC